MIHKNVDLKCHLRCFAGMVSIGSINWGRGGNIFRYAECHKAQWAIRMNISEKETIIYSENVFSEISDLTSIRLNGLMAFGADTFNPFQFINYSLFIIGSSSSDDLCLIKFVDCITDTICLVVDVFPSTRLSPKMLFNVSLHVPFNNVFFAS